MPQSAWIENHQSSCNPNLFYNPHLQALLDEYIKPCPSLHLGRQHATHFVFFHKMQQHLQHFGAAHYPCSFVPFVSFASKHNIATM
jgi:hypothetical protein